MSSKSCGLQLIINFALLYLALGVTSVRSHLEYKCHSSILVYGQMLAGCILLCYHPAALV